MYNRSGQQTWTPPPNFAMVETGVYRSAYPTLPSVPYLRHIGIQTIVLLSIELLPAPVMRALTAGRQRDKEAAPIRVECAASLTAWMNESAHTRDDFAASDVQRALGVALDATLHPVLLACPTGELQTSVVVGCARRLMGWTLAAAMAEADLFGGARGSVMRFVERWDPREAATAHRRRREGGETDAEDAVDGKGASPEVQLARWYTHALTQRAGRAVEIRAARERRAAEDGTAAPLEPHERFMGVPNPPAHDERSTFTKESIVEEDDN